MNKRITPGSAAAEGGRVEGRSPGTNWNHLLCAVALFELFAGQTLKVTPDCYPLYSVLLKTQKPKTLGWRGTNTQA
ncbi:hypothetical protein [Endozoicomonas lisbonensis]|uniref:Uncharacterized protein n=1 Tax=Endozoicomonas lisbonensis TaxID=3120522 RepID=A0ABV2SEJ5_9GAMM